MKSIKALVLGVGLLVGVFFNHQAMAWCGGDGTPDCSATYYNMIDQTSPYYQGGGGGYSGPIITPPPEMIMPDSWGAFADGSKGTGIASKQASKQASEQVALQNCASTGATDCKISEVYKNTCIVMTNKSYMIHPKLSEARKEAMRGCHILGKGARCYIRYEECMP